MNWLFRSSLYFNLCFVMGMLFWVILGFDFSRDELQIFAAENAPRHLASINDSNATPNDIYLTTIVKEKNIMNAISDKELESLLLGDEKAQKKVNEQLEYQENFLTQFASSYPDFNVDEDGNKLVSSAANTVNYEELKYCGADRLIYEKMIESRKKEVRDYLIEREDPTDADRMPRLCVTHVMNKFSVRDFHYARCNGTAGAPAHNGKKPCISKNLVNYTYNALMDVAACMNLNPKSLLPKLSNESGLILNTIGSSQDAGVGQLTSDAITEANKFYPTYLKEIAAAAANGKESCQRLLKYEKLLSRVAPSSSARCSLIAPVENPLRNILYMAIYNRLNIDFMSGIKYKAGVDYINDKAVTYTEKDHVAGAFEKFNINKLLKDAGLAEVDKVNFHRLVEMVTLLGYNAGPQTAFKMLMDYLHRRIAHNKLANAKKKFLTDADFDFHNPRKQKDDVDGIERTVVEIARLNVNSPMIKKNDKNTKTTFDRIRILPEKIRVAHLLTFPEFLIYRQNNFDVSILNPANLAKVNEAKDADTREKLRSTFPSYRTFAAPGYLNFLAAKDNSIRETFLTAGQSEWICSDKNFLRIKNHK